MCNIIFGSVSLLSNMVNVVLIGLGMRLLL